MADKVLHVHDVELGYVPRPGVRGHVRDGGAVTIDADGLRFTGEVAAAAGSPLVLAVGDSFTYGEHVGDLDAWPAQLQRLIGHRVLNGGVSGYGFDQTVLRAERLAARHRPDVMIVGLIADDVRRTEMRRLWWHDKPWFDVEHDRLVPRGVPVPDRALLPVALRRILEQILIGLPPGLQHLTGYSVRVHPPGAGASISRLLVDRLAALQRTEGVRILLLAQYDVRVWAGGGAAEAQRRVLQPLLQRAAALGLSTFDTFSRLAAEPEPRRFYGPIHMNARGNRLIAGVLSARLASLR
ncbi:hypothetical protein KQ910_12735 [Reyranella sp. MMS21-HV4-11]|uniref:SGNH hydrolase-type esterase domain-containing protein n=1 Tax=Reyranella humidisoli TaxID=2849149 RepID=A0ABS6IK25_9HYPH|nr:GDSL-type esterase/lipase family protein [Reyranella sp. MMS21-HV4-11]MBU8874633.1 hypothetical protein [Reyranella sp. MMS21-HV4-11]